TAHDANADSPEAEPVTAQGPILPRIRHPAKTAQRSEAGFSRMMNTSSDVDDVRGGSDTCSSRMEVMIRMPAPDVRASPHRCQSISQNRAIATTIAAVSRSGNQVCG